MTKRLKSAVLIAATGLLAAACTGGGQTSASGGGGSVDDMAKTHRKGGSVTIANESGQTWTCQFNPFNPAVSALANGFVYEPLVYVDPLENAAETPMLAKSYQWSADKKSITFTVRSGVKWSDGQPFTAADVAFTFNLMKKYPATDLYSLWTGAGLQSATAHGDEATLTFKSAAQPYFYSFADQVTIVPQHIWSTGAAAADPDTWADTAPVGTGPFTVHPCSPNEITYTANPTYWQPGKPYIQTVHYPAYLDNNPADLDLASGKAQWGGQYIPDIANFYTNRDPNNHYWFAPTTNIALYPNLAPSHAATSKLAVRQAIALAIDRDQISQIGESGYQPAANQTGIVLPTFKSYYDAAADAASGYTKPDITKAKALMASAGYSPANPLNLTVITVTGYTDWDASLAVIKQQLAPIGINLTVSDLAAQTYDDRLYKGDYDLAYSGQNGGPTPYTELREILYSKNSAPLGSIAASNFERYDNPAVDALFNGYASADPAQQVAIIKKIEAAMLADVPVIPTTESVNWYEYNTQDLGGWPTAANPYAQAAPFNIPDVEQVLLHLYSKSAQ